MKRSVHPASERGHFDHGWLMTWHSFSFASWYNPSKMGFGALRVLNDDIISPGKGFGMHPHNDMEIFTIPLEGSLEHRDNMGNGEVISPGEIQVMTAGTGIYHSEFNPSSEIPVSLLQIWIHPRQTGLKPGYDQRRFDLANMYNRLQTVISPDAGEDTLHLNQDAWVSLGYFNQSGKLQYTLHKEGQGVYTFIIEGTAGIDDIVLKRRDGAGFSETDSIALTVGTDSRILLIEVPME